MSDFHFVNDYRDLVSHLKAGHDHATAMDLAVGGNSEELGRIEAAILKHFGLVKGMSVVDFGCGSGRLSWGLTVDKDINGDIHYTGLDVVQDLLDHAASKSAPHFRFVINHSLTFPLASNSTDIVNAFSVFTHLHQAEIAIYLGEMHRILKPGGKAIVSYQSLEDHWNIFEQTISQHRAYKKPWPHLNMFVEHDQMSLIARSHGFMDIDWVPYNENPWKVEGPLGQNIVVIQKKPV